MNQFKNKTVLLRKKTVILLPVLFFLFAATASPANAWDALGANMALHAVETIEKTIAGIQMGAVKNAAMVALNQEMEYLITGKSPGFVTDWGAYAIKQPNDKATLFAESLISKALNGRGSLTGYIPRGSEGFGMNSSYLGRLDRGARQLLQAPTCQITYQGEPREMFNGTEKKPFQKLGQLFDGNMPQAFDACITAQRLKAENDNRFIAQLKLTPGVLGKEENGITINPAGLVEAQVAKVRNMGIDIMTMANNLPEVISGAVSNMINQSMINGIGQIQSAVHREVSNVRSQAIHQMDKAISQVGPAAMYGVAVLNNAHELANASQVAACNSCLNSCATDNPSGGPSLTACQSACAPKCKGN